MSQQSPGANRQDALTKTELSYPKPQRDPATFASREPLKFQIDRAETQISRAVAQIERDAFWIDRAGLQIDRERFQIDRERFQIDAAALETGAACPRIDRAVFRIRRDRGQTRAASFRTHFFRTMKDTHTNRLDAFRAVLAYLTNPVNVPLWKDQRPLRFTKRAAAAAAAVPALAKFCEEQSSILSGLAADKAREEKELEDAAYVLGKAVAECYRELGNEADAAKVDFSQSEWRAKRDADLLAAARETIKIARALLAGPHAVEAEDCGIDAHLVDETEREADEFQAALGTPRAAIASRRALTIQMRDRFNAVEAIFASMDGLVEQFRDESFVEGYFAARSVVDAGHRRKKSAPATKA